MIYRDEDLTEEDLFQFISDKEGHSVFWGNHFKDETIASMLRKDHGDYLPWSKTHHDILLRPGEMSLWSGINGHKKSLMLVQIMLWLARTQKVGVMSFELTVAATIHRMAQQAAGCKPWKEFIKQFCDWTDQRICYYDKLDSVPRTEVLGAVHNMATEKECKHIVIDSLMMVQLPRGDDGERLFVEKLAAAAKAHQIHIHLVHHMRKPPDSKGDAYVPNRFDVRGDSGIVDKVDNLFIVWEDKKRKRLKQKIAQSGTLDDKEQEYFNDNRNPDQRLICAKQRHGSWEGTKGLYFHDDSLQFTGTNSDQPMPFLLEDEPTQSTMEV
ncbi:MAG: hypothetical protein V3V40_06460 [Nitrosomonadaceae bacterium]